MGRGGVDCGVFPRLPAALHIRVSHPEALPDLVDALAERVHYVVGTVGPDRVAVGVLGSFADSGEDELKRFLDEWKAGRPGIGADVEMDDLRAVAVLPIPLPRPVIHRAGERGRDDETHPIRSASCDS